FKEHFRNNHFILSGCPSRVNHFFKLFNGDFINLSHTPSKKQALFCLGLQSIMYQRRTVINVPLYVF
ncbi:hypothetical protein, partial [Brevibacillus agri]|uniref:hypothetical protein n=1 Tax=Brevibacillus agri TaxID=51101 RepID=UPI003D1EE581